MNTSEGQRIARRASTQFLNARIDDNYRSLRKLGRDLHLQKEQLIHISSSQHLQHLEPLRELATASEQTQAKARQKHKFDTLLREKDKEEPPKRLERWERWVVNLSSKELDDHQKSMLAKGLNFVPAPLSIPTKRIASTIESALRCVPQEAATDVRLQVISMLRQARPPPNNITPEEGKAIKALRGDNNLMILPADKGRATVLLDRAEYDRKMQAMLDDERTYRKLKKDPAALERKMNALLLSLNRKGRIPDKLYDTLRSTAGRNPQLYGLPKIHKPDVPLRPIVSFVQSPTYHLSKHLSDLSPLVGKSASAVRNTKDFVDCIAT